MILYDDVSLGPSPEEVQQFLAAWDAWVQRRVTSGTWTSEVVYKHDRRYERIEFGTGGHVSIISTGYPSFPPPCPPDAPTDAELHALDRGDDCCWASDNHCCEADHLSRAEYDAREGQLGDDVCAQIVREGQEQMVEYRTMTEM